MSEANAQEPTMEEILASIRRIISEDETPAPDAAAGAVEEAPPPPVAEAPPPPPKADPPKVTSLKIDPPKVEAAKPPEPAVLELTQRVEPPPPPPRAPPPVSEIDLSDTAPAPAPRAAPTPSPALVSDRAASSAAAHFGQLAQSVAPAAGRSLEEIVTEMLRPMLKDWLDENLPKIVEASVAAEVERISRRGY